MKSVLLVKGMQPIVNSQSTIALLFVEDEVFEIHNPFVKSAIIIYIDHL